MRSSRQAVHAVLALTVVAAFGACDREDRADVDTALAKAGDAVGGVVDSAAGRLGGRGFSNAELLGFINAYNDAEIEIGEMAQPKATDAQVRAFAQRIVGEHRALKTEVTSTAQRLNLSATAPEDDEDVREEHEEGMRALRDQARGREFDQRFIEHEIAMHKRVLDEIEDALEGNRNTEIRPLLEQARTGIRAHLTAAEALDKKFDAT